MKSIPKQMLKAGQKLIKASAGREEIYVQYSLTWEVGNPEPKAMFYARVGNLSRSNVFEIDESLDVALLRALAKCQSLLSERDQEIATLKERAEKLGLQVTRKGTLP